MALKQWGMATLENTASSLLCQTSHGPPSGPLKNSQPSLNRVGASGSSAPAGVLMARASEGERCSAAAAPATLAPRASNWRRVNVRVSFGFNALWFRGPEEGHSSDTVLYPPKLTAYRSKSRLRSAESDQRPSGCEKDYFGLFQTVYGIYSKLRQLWSYICRGEVDTWPSAISELDNPQSSSRWNSRIMLATTWRTWASFPEPMSRFYAVLRPATPPCIALMAWRLPSARRLPATSPSN